jgi:myo-inositol 2-dehydrogenase/D-chiro-inositol 1-dehydrogenase
MQSTVSQWGPEGAGSDAFQNFFLDRYAEAYRREMAHFAQILRGEAKPLVGYADAVDALALAEAAQESSQTGKVVKL